MALIIEDGTIVTNANSYATRAELIAYGLIYGVTVADDETSDNQLVKAAVHLNHVEPSLSGYRVERDQSLAYPRYDLSINGFNYNSNEIPNLVKQCQMALTLDLIAGIDLNNRTETLPTIKERIEGAVEVQYATPNSVSGTTAETIATQLLRQLMKFSSIRLVRL